MLRKAKPAASKPESFDRTYASRNRNVNCETIAITIAILGVEYVAEYNWNL
jgi:hypothetical protein